MLVQYYASFLWNSCNFQYLIFGLHHYASEPFMLLLAQGAWTFDQALNWGRYMEGGIETRRERGWGIGGREGLDGEDRKERIMHGHDQHLSIIFLLKLLQEHSPPLILPRNIPHLSPTTVAVLICFFIYWIVNLVMRGIKLNEASIRQVILLRCGTPTSVVNEERMNFPTIYFNLYRSTAQNMLATNAYSTGTPRWRRPGLYPNEQSPLSSGRTYGTNSIQIVVEVEPVQVWSGACGNCNSIGWRRPTILNFWLARQSTTCKYLCALPPSVLPLLITFQGCSVMNTKSPFPVLN